MDSEINASVVVTVRWNALEVAVLSYVQEGKGLYPEEKEYTLEEIEELNNRVAKAMNPGDDSVTVPGRFLEPGYQNINDVRDVSPVEMIFNKTEELASDVDRLEQQVDTFRYYSEEEEL